MPLKHHLETAYVILLSVVVAGYGVLLSLLPHFPQGVLYWGVLLVVSILYPLVLIPTFRTNRADYEFRFLHWTPAAMTLLWGILEVFSRRSTAALILQLGFTYLWSLPLVILGFTLLMLFCLQVIRRQTVRVTVLGIVLAVFFAMSIAAEATDWNKSAQHALFPATPASNAVASQYSRLVARIGSPQSQPTGSGAIAMASSASASSTKSSSSAKSSSVSSSSSKSSSVSSTAIAWATSSSSFFAFQSSASSVHSSSSATRSSSSSLARSAVAVASSLSSSSLAASFSSSSVSSSKGMVAMASSSSSSTPMFSFSSSSSRPSTLPHAGPEDAVLAFIIITMIALYSHRLHVRAVRRNEVE